MKSKLEIYALSVSFASVVCLIFTFGIGGYAIFEVLMPDITINAHEFNKHQSNDAYWESINHSKCKSDADHERPSENELTRQRLASYEIEIKSEKREGFQTIIQSLIFIAVAGITLLIHFRIARSARQNCA